LEFTSLNAVEVTTEMREGERDYDRNLSLSDNPYKYQDSLKYRDWLIGWTNRQAYREYQFQHGDSPKGPSIDDFEFKVGDLVWARNPLCSKWQDGKHINWIDPPWQGRIKKQIYDNEATDHTPFWYTLEPVGEVTGCRKPPYVVHETEIDSEPVLDMDCCGLRLKDFEKMQKGVERLITHDDSVDEYTDFLDELMKIDGCA
jgi:hypothetical protein